MARPHHRKKHKEHLRQFKRSQETTQRKSRGKASTTFVIAGVAVGLILGYLASQGQIVWMGAGLVAGGIIGYLIGSRIDKP